MLKIFAQQQQAKTPNDVSDQYVFAFTGGGKAREEANAIKDELSTAIQAAKTAQNTSVPSAGGQVATTAAAAAAAGNRTATPDATKAGATAPVISMTVPGQAPWNDNNRLKGDAELQQSLLRSDPNLQRMFMESVRSKPETLTTAQFMSQFWTTRLHLLRAHAIERGQTRGSYNVLSTLKPRVEDNVTKLNISKEQIQLIFSQHPLIKRVYDENVPKLTEQQFWSRFFQSRLFKKLRGERVSEADATDAILDKYLKNNDDYDQDPSRRQHDMQVPHFIDLAANEENNSQRMGNRPDIDMRPTSIPIIKTLNSLSERIMGNVGPADHDPSTETPAGVDEDTLEELQLRDLRGDKQQSKPTLNIRDQSRFFAHARFAEDEESQLFAKQDPEKVLIDLRTDLAGTLPGDGSAQLDKLVEPDEDEEEEEEEEEEDNHNLNKSNNQKTTQQQVGSKKNLKKASTQILSSIRDRRAQAEQQQQQQSSSSNNNMITYGLSPNLFDRLTITHATTTEFLHQFWQTFLSGSPERVGELSSLVESLHRALDRIKAVSNDAEAERMEEVDRRKAQLREVFTATGRRMPLNLGGIGGGEKVVGQLLGPTVRAVEGGLKRYNDALAKEVAVGHSV